MTIPECPKILAVDDVPDNLLLLKAILGGVDNYRLSCFESGRAALEAIAESPPDLVILDVMMPDMDGFEVTRCIRQGLQLPDMPILLITAHHEVNTNQSLEVGANSLIHKPFDIQEFLNQVQILLAEKHE